MSLMFHGPFIITGTDTNAGKTIASAALLAHTRGRYWKPLQSGTDDITGLTDTDHIRRITALPAAHFLPETCRLSAPLSPHRAAELEGVTINPQQILEDYNHHLSCPLPHAPCLLIEGAGGLLVPLTRNLLQIDLFVQMQSIARAPIILVSRTGLGTINHTLLSLAAIQARSLPLQGILFSGEDNPDNIRTIAEFSGAQILGRIPVMDKINAQTLADLHFFA